MLARLLRIYYFLLLLMGAGLGHVLLPHSLPRPLALTAGAVAWLLLWQLLVIAGSMIMSGGSGQDGSASVRWRAFWGELRAALTVYLLRQTWAGSAPGVLAPLNPAAPGSEAPLPVLLVHGYICNHRVWDDVARALRQAGHTVLTVDLEPLFTSIDHYAPLIENAVDALQQATGAPRVALVGHSMGGLAIRAWMRAHGTARVARVVTLGTPHQGTRMVQAGLTPNTAQMAWHSDWLHALEQGETPQQRALMHLALTTHDNIVYPQRAQTLSGATVTEFTGLGHLEMCLSPAVIGWLVERLADLRAATSAETSVAAIETAQRPASRRALFWAFTVLALQGFGGVVAIVQREMVERKRWLTREQFVEDWAVSQVLPGPNVVNLCLMIGDRYFGWRGGLTALAGLLFFPLLIVLLLAVILSGVSDTPAVQGALRGMGAVAAGMITATGLKLLGAIKQNVLGPAVGYLLALLTFVAVALLRLPLVWVLLGLGGLAGLYAYRLLAPAQPTQEAP